MPDTQYQKTILHDTVHVDAIYTIHYFEYYNTYAFKGERHDFWELLYVDKGLLYVEAEDRKLCLEQGQMIFHRPNEFHALQANGSIAPNTIVVSFSCRDPAIEALSGYIGFVNQTERQLLSNILQEAGAAFVTDLGDPTYQKLVVSSESPLGCEQLIRLYLETLLLSFLRKRDRMKKDTPTTMQHNLERHYYEITREYIEKNIDSAFSLKGLAGQAMVSVSYLERLFRRFSGISVMQYCTRCKIEEAKKMIREDRANITQIAEYLGFSSIHYFSRVFKKFEGMSPSEYGRSVKALKDRLVER